MRRAGGIGFAAVLTALIAAACAGVTSYAAAAQWIADLPRSVLSRIGIGPGRPAISTLRRMVLAADAELLDAVCSAWLAARSAAERPDGRQQVIAVDGKSVRGAIGADGRCEHLLAAADHRSGVVLAQLAVAAKTNEIPMLAPLLDRIAIRGAVVTVDALHTQRAAASYLHRRGAHYIFTVKDNQPRLRARLAALPWAQVPGVSSTNSGHGRIETRTVKVTSVQRGIGFPHAHLAIQVTRLRRVHGKNPTREVGYAITDMTWEQTNPAELAAMIRGHWTIENQLHWVRDVTFGEDAATTRTGTSAQVKATMTNIAISLHRLAGADNIAAATRAIFRDPHRFLELIA